MLSQIQDNTNKAYVALQSAPLTNTAQIPLPDVVNTRRPKMTSKQIARRYLESVKDNPDIDINKQGLKNDNAPHTATLRQRRHLPWGSNCGLNKRHHIESLTTVSDDSAKNWEDISCDSLGHYDYGDNILWNTCKELEKDNYFGTSDRGFYKLKLKVMNYNDKSPKICDQYGTHPIFVDERIAEKAFLIRDPLRNGLIQPMVTKVFTSEIECNKINENFGPAACEYFKGNEDIQILLNKNSHIKKDDRGHPTRGFDAVFITDLGAIISWANQSSDKRGSNGPAFAVLREEIPVEPWRMPVVWTFSFLPVLPVLVLLGKVIKELNRERFQDITSAIGSLKDKVTCCTPKDIETEEEQGEELQNTNLGNQGLKETTANIINIENNAEVNIDISNDKGNDGDLGPMDGEESDYAENASSSILVTVSDSTDDSKT